MNTDSRQTIHIGINFVFSPAPIIESQSNWQFQKSLMECGIECSRAELKDRGILIVRETPPRLEIRVGNLPNSPVGQLLVVSSDPRCELELFIKDTEAVIEAFKATWKIANRQIISNDVTIRDLYEATEEHAFKELWEKRLHQAPNSLARFGRPVLGGGLRFVMPPRQDDTDPVQIEVKIESFLQDTKKIFLETQFVWLSSKSPGDSFDPNSRLKDVDQYIERQVEAFVVGGD